MLKTVFKAVEPAESCHFGAKTKKTEKFFDTGLTSRFRLFRRKNYNFSGMSDDRDLQFPLPHRYWNCKRARHLSCLLCLTSPCSYPENYQMERANEN